MKGKRNDKDKTVSGMKNTANYITTGRIGLALSLFFVPPLTISFYIVYLLCGLSDMADGFIARKTHTESASTFAALQEGFYIGIKKLS